MGFVLITMILIVGAISAVYLRDMNRVHERVLERGTVIPSPYGDIEYTDGGSGPNVLVIHGSGGGYDQGELIAQAVLGDRFHWISPSRFGYLRSGLHATATWDDQADAYAFLLDDLGIDRVAVVAISHGGPSALLFAVLHPERVSSLILISCGVVASDTRDQAEADSKGDTLTTLFRHNSLYWAISRVFRKQLMALMGADETTIADLSQNQRELIEQFIDRMNPVALRSAGVVFDNRAPLPGKRIADIKAPTLIIHAADDRLQLYHNAEFAADTIPGARLIRFENGGHFVIGVEQERIREAVVKHILDQPGKDI